MVSTYILYNLADDRSASLIAAEKGFLKYAPLPSTPIDPAIIPSEILNNDLVCVGSWIANPYTAYYFPNLRFDKLYNPTIFPTQPEIWKIAGEFGISADGKCIVYSIKRANGTMVTVVAGVHESDTWKSANAYVSAIISPLIPIGISVVAVGGSVGLIARHK